MSFTDPVDLGRSSFDPGRADWFCHGLRFTLRFSQWNEDRCIRFPALGDTRVPSMTCEKSS
jgi:hypothetical protein